MSVAVCHCPTCGAPYTADRPRIDLDRNIFICADGAIRVMPQQAELLAVLIKAMPLYARTEAILRGIYGAAEGAEFELDNLRVQLSKLRGLLRPLGWKIENIWHRGYRLERIGGSE